MVLSRLPRAGGRGRPAQSRPSMCGGCSGPDSLAAAPARLPPGGAQRAAAGAGAARASAGLAT